MPVFTQYASDIYHRCDELAMFSQSSGKIDRQYLTSEHSAVNDLVSQWMLQAGMKTHIDESGNVWGRYESDVSEAKTLVLGSHLDTVPNAGKYDGILGVLTPISLIEYCNENEIRFPFHIDIVGFGDEEGSRFGTTLLGSRATTGTWQQKWALLKDKANVDLATAMRDFGLDINKIDNACLEPDTLLGFLELHIEQGPVLEAQGLPLGVVNVISGAKRYRMTVTGESGHAGTVPMSMRKDALVASCEMITAMNSIASEFGVVATTGEIHNYPNGVNVIPGESHFSLDIRSQSDLTRDDAIRAIKSSLAEIAAKHNVTLDIKKTHHADAVNCDPGLSECLGRAIELTGQPVFQITSGAGHDAMEMANICPMSMLFMRCKGGISHHPDESVMPEDIDTALAAMFNFLKLLPQSSRLTGSEVSLPQSVHEPS